MIEESVKSSIAGQAEPFKRLMCEQCGVNFDAKNRNGIPKRFCSQTCRTVWHNDERSRLYKKSSAAKPRLARRVSPGQRRIDVEVIPEAQRPALLLAAARSLGLTEEGPILREARRQAASERAPV